MRGEVTYLLWHGTRLSYNHIKIRGVRVYIINGRDTRKNLDDRPHRGYFIGYETNIGIILYWKPDQPFVIHISHHVWFDEYNYRLSIEDKHTLCYLLLRKYPEGHIYDSYLLNLITRKLDLISNTFSNIKITKYNIELPPSGKKVGFNLLDDEDFTIPYITDTVPNSPAGHQLRSQAKRNVWIVDINGE